MANLATLMKHMEGLSTLTIAAMVSARMQQLQLDPSPENLKVCKILCIVFVERTKDVSTVDQPEKN